MSTHSSASRHREWKLGCKVYIGNLAEGASKSDIEGAFSKYGPLRNVWVARNPPGFAFVEFEDGRDAEDACRHLDGTRIAGGRIKAEMSHGRTRRGRGGGGGGGHPGYRGGHPGGPYGGGARASYREPRGHSNGNDIGVRGYYDSGDHNSHGEPRGQSNGNDIGVRGYYDSGGHNSHGEPRGQSNGNDIGVRGYYDSGDHNSHGDRPPRDRHAPRSPLGIKESFRHYSRSRSNSPPAPIRTARPRTPPSRTVSPDRH